MTLPSYDFYKNTYGGSKSESDFNIAIRKSGYYLDELTFGRDIPGEMTERSYYAACELADFIANSGAGQATAAGAIKSESVDGYSVTYATSESENVAQTGRAKAMSIAKQWLAYPVNLIYCGR